MYTHKEEWYELNGKSLKYLLCNFPVYNLKGKPGNLKKQSLLSFRKSRESGASSLEVYSFSQDKCRKSLARMWVKENQPFSVFDDDGFGSLYRTCNHLVST